MQFSKSGASGIRTLLSVTAFFLLLQGQRGPAIIGYGRVNRKAHRNDAGELVASVKFESLVDPSIEVLAGTDKLLAIGGRQGVWRTPFSGVRLQDKIAAKLEALVVTGMVSDDTYDDLGIDPSLLGSDGAPRFVMKKSGVKRDPAVRREVIRGQRTGASTRHARTTDDIVVSWTFITFSARRKVTGYGLVLRSVQTAIGPRITRRNAMHSTRSCLSLLPSFVPPLAPRTPHNGCRSVPPRLSVRSRALSGLGRTTPADPAAIVAYLRCLRGLLDARRFDSR